MTLAAIQCTMLAVKKYRSQSHVQYKQCTWEQKKKLRSKILLSLHQTPLCSLGASVVYITKCSKVMWLIYTGGEENDTEVIYKRSFLKNFCQSVLTSLG